MEFLTLQDVEIKNKTVFVRADLNCPVEDGKVQPSPRMVEHAKTIYKLSQMGAKTVILAHEGREGKDDFISLEQHSKLLARQLEKCSKSKIPLKFIDDVAGKKAKYAIKALKPGEALLLQNVRFLKSEIEFEKTQKSELVQNLSPLCEIFVLDAFSVSHRAQASVVGFTNCPAVAGPVMQAELEALTHLENPKRPSLLILGGAKPADSLPILEEWIISKKADFAICGGAMGNLMLMASGKKLGTPSEEFLQTSGSLKDFEKICQFYKKFSKSLLIPQDVVVAANSGAKTISAQALPSQFPILDIGEKTIADFKKQISLAGSIVLNGPMGVYEKDEFSHGTKEILLSVANSPAFSLVGGGHTLSALEEFSIPHSKFGYVSLSGKALVEFLCGQQLPGITMLGDSFRRFS
ncbi:MAG: phosphoglycerate kinase [Candidatus Micrarchaeota archaeon]